MEHGFQNVVRLGLSWLLFRVPTDGAKCCRTKNGGERFVLRTGLDVRCLRIFCVEKNQVQNVVLVVRGRALYIDASKSEAE